MTSINGTTWLVHAMLAQPCGGSLSYSNNTCDFIKWSNVRFLGGIGRSAARSFDKGDACWLRDDSEASMTFFLSSFFSLSSP